MTTKHPPLKAGETFAGNVLATNGVPAHIAHLQTVRLARPAYDIYGDPLPDHCALIFGAADLQAYDRIMEARLSAIRRGVRT